MNGLCLDDAALRVITATINVSVLAGPGAGKTEVLAQRASYLLQTNLCHRPRKILAISFKRDAASNIQERVKLRCGVELASRFESLTFDAFAKRLVDHFRLSLPEEYCPSDDYDIWPSTRVALNDALSNLQPPEHFRYRLARINRNEFLKSYALQTLPHLPSTDESIEMWAIRNLWNYLIQELKQLSFPMITRLAEYMLRTNPMIVSALRSTYSHVFLDEFQDTTELQYDLLRTGFIGSTTVLTAVGDEKQRIMGWAGALEASFEKFDNDFCATRHILTKNFRSAPRLIDMQQVLSRSLTTNQIAVVPGKQWADDDGTCHIWRFDDNLYEALFLSEAIKRWMESDRIQPRDICILVKQKPLDYCQTLIDTLSEVGIRARIESELQDLLAEPCTRVILDFMTVVLDDRAPREWSNLVDVVNQVHSNPVGAFGAHDSVDLELRSFIGDFRFELFSLGTTDEHRFARLVLSIFALVKVTYFRNSFPQYRRGTYFFDMIQRCTRVLWDTYLVTTDWMQTVQLVRGTDTIPIMTIHKSKGLEYHTVIFLGLEDQAFWNFTAQEQADTAAFFVAFSRAKRRVIFTFSHIRDKKQSRQTIQSLYNLLTEAGVPEIYYPTPYD